MSHRLKDEVEVILPEDSPKGPPKIQVVGVDSKGRAIGVRTQDCGAQGPKG